MKLLGKLAAFAAAALAGYFAIGSWMKDVNEDHAVAKVAATIDELRDQGMQKHPDLPISEATRQEALSRSVATLNAETDPSKRRTTAAANFLGFYIVNTQERARYCREQGVDIAAFVTAFEQGHAKELAAARPIVARTGISEDKLYGMLSAQLRKIVEQDIADIAKSANLSAQGACEFIATNGVALAAEMHVSKQHPQVFEILSQAR